MAVEFKINCKRGTEYLFPPEKIKVSPELNGRTELPDIEWLIESMVAIGQRVPVEIRSDGGYPVLTLGYSRWRAAIEINKRKLVPGGFLLRCAYSRCNEREGFIANLMENLVRNDPTPIDDANNIRRLESWGRTPEEIADIYRRKNAKGEPDVAWVKKRLTLISLGEEARAAVKNGRLKVSAAAEIAKLSEEQQRAVVAGEGKVTAAAAHAVAGGKPKKAGMKDVREILRAVVEDGKYPEGFGIDKETPEDALHLFCGLMLDLIAGRAPESK